jgi:hypothetical protein
VIEVGCVTAKVRQGKALWLLFALPLNQSHCRTLEQLLGDVHIVHVAGN